SFLLARVLSCPVDFRSLLSFPTRRSSDLSFDDRLELGLASIEDMPEDQVSLLTDDQSVDGQLVEASEQSAAQEEAEGDDPSPAPDRKSTRLNSSHVKISYAVFCLKKKKST